jgi:hypothetical protein
MAPGKEASFGCDLDVAGPPRTFAADGQPATIPRESMSDSSNPKMPTPCWRWFAMAAAKSD